MTAKKMNFLILACILLFCLIGGFVGVYRYNTFLKLDAEHDNRYAQDRAQSERDTLTDIEISSKNENRNEGNTLSPSYGSDASSDNVDVSSFDFIQMVEYATSKLETAANISSTAIGMATFSGPTSRGISLSNEKVAFNFTRAKNATQSYVLFGLNGTLLGGLATINRTAGSYSEGSTYYLQNTSNGPTFQPSSHDNNFNNLRFEANQTFHILNASSIKVGTENLFYNKYDQTYTGSCELITSVSAQNFSYTLKYMMGGKSPATYTSSKVEIVFDKTGKFKSIKYSDEFKIEVYDAGFDTTIHATITGEYTETFKTIGNKHVSITKPAGV